MLVGSIAASARAGEEDGKAFFEEGRRLRKAGDCRGAIEQFRRSWAAWPAALGPLRNLAECEEEVGRIASARRSWSDLRREALRSTEERYHGWDGDAAEHYQALEPRVSRLTLLVEASDPKKVTVSIDGEKIPAELVASPLERDPGMHEIVAEKDGARVVEHVALLEGERRDFRLKLPDAIEPAKKGLSGPMIGAAASLTLAGLGAVGMAVAGGLRQSALADLRGKCPDYAAPDAICPPDARDPIDRGKRAALTFNVSAIVAGAGAVIGGTLLAVALSKSDLKPAGAVWLTPLPGGAAFGGGVTF